MTPTPPDPDRFINVRDVRPLGPAEGIDVGPALVTYATPDGGEEPYPAVVFTFTHEHEDGNTYALSRPVIVPAHLLHHLDERIMAAAGEALALVEKMNTGGEAALANEFAGQDGVGLYRFTRADQRTTFLAGDAREGERATGMLRRSTCAVCGIPIFADVADRGACLDCDPPVEVEAAVDLGPA